MDSNPQQERLPVIQLLLVLFTFVFVQEGWTQKYSLGVKAGASITWPGFGEPEFDEIYNRRLTPGFSAALLLGFPLKHHYDILFEAGYSQRGRILTVDQGVLWQNNMTMQLADMNMMLRKSFKFRLKKDTPSEVFFGLGPEISYWIASSGFIQAEDGLKYNYKVLFDEPAPENTLEMHYALEDPNRWLFSLGIGAGVKAPLRKGHFLTTEFRFSSGHTFLGSARGATLRPVIVNLDDLEKNMKTNLKAFNISLAYTIDFDRVERRKGKSTIKKKLRK